MSQNTLSATRAPAGPVPAALNFPLGVALMPDGSVAITDMVENVLLRLK